MLHALSDEGWENNVKWCVPSVISIITGMPLAMSHMKAAFYENIGIKDVETVAASNAIMILNEEGFICEKIDLKSRYPQLEYGPSIKRFMKELQGFEKAMPLMISVGDGKASHMIAAHMEFICDNSTMKPIHYTKFHKLGRAVKNAWIVKRKNYK